MAKAESVESIDCYYSLLYGMVDSMTEPTSLEDILVSFLDWAISQPLFPINAFGGNELVAHLYLLSLKPNVRIAHSCRQCMNGQSFEQIDEAFNTYTYLQETGLQFEQIVGLSPIVPALTELPVTIDFIQLVGKVYRCHAQISSENIQGAIDSLLASFFSFQLKQITVFCSLVPQTVFGSLILQKFFVLNILFLSSTFKTDNKAQNYVISHSIYLFEIVPSDLHKSFLLRVSK